MAQAPYRNLKDGRIVLLDKAGNSVTIVGEDDSGFSWDEPDNIEAIMDRGVLSQWRHGVEEPVTFSATINFKYLVADTGETLSPYEVFRFIGGAAAWVSTNLTCTDVDTMTVRFELKAPCSGADGERVVFTQVPKPAFSYQDGSPVSTLGIEGKALMNKLPLPTRVDLTTTTTTTTTTTA